PVRITAAVEPFVMIFCRERNIRIWMADGHKDLVTDARMLVQLRRFLCIYTVRRVDDLSLDRDLADVVQVARNRRAFDFLLFPTELFRDNFGIFPYAYGMALGVFVLTVDRRRKRFYCVVV